MREKGEAAEQWCFEVAVSTNIVGWANQVEKGKEKDIGMVL